MIRLRIADWICLPAAVGLLAAGIATFGFPPRPGVTPAECAGEVLTFGASFLLALVGLLVSMARREWERQHRNRRVPACLDCPWCAFDSSIETEDSERAGGP